MEDNKIRIASFDIGKKNFAFLIEEVDISVLTSIVNIPVYQRYNIDSTPTDEFKIILNNVFSSGRIILYINSDITTGCSKSKNIEQRLLYNMQILLDEYSIYFDTCSIIIIEKQMAFGNKINTIALKLGQNCMSYFVFKYGMFKEIVEFPAYHKTQILGCSKILKSKKNEKNKYVSVNKYTRKKWSIQEAINILSIRSDNTNLNHLLKSKKKDDLADTLTQLQAYKYINFVDTKN